jgi:hypothetical protein
VNETAESPFDELREGISLRAARKEWVEDSAGGRACGVTETQAEAHERSEIARAQEYQRRVEAAYGRQVSIQAARAAVRSSLADPQFADLATDASAPNVLAGTTQEVIEKLRRGHPEWVIRWSPEQRSQGQQFGGVAYGPGSVSTVGDPAMAQNVLDHQERDRLRRTVG